MMLPNQSKSPAPPIRASLASSKVFRAITRPILRGCDFPVTVTHPLAGMPFRSLGLTHKPLWQQGRQAKLAELRYLRRHLKPGDTVFEVGAHIGFTTQMLASVVGGHGQVHAFEPGQQNRDFLGDNIRTFANATHINAAVSHRTGKATFYEDHLGGFRGSLRSEFAQTRARISKHGAMADVSVRDVHTVTVDYYAAQHGLHVDVMCIDAEGAELDILRNAQATMGTVHTLMIKVTKNHEAVYDLLRHAGFALTTAQGLPLTSFVDGTGSIFAFRSDASLQAPVSTDRM